MSNFGFLNLRLVNPYATAFREARSAVGASKVLENAEEYNTVADAVGDCTLVVGTTAVGARNLHHPLKRLEQGALLLRKRLKSDRVAILFGSERRGLSNSDLSHCHWLLRIPTRDVHRSMNLGQAVAVCLYELIRDPRVIREKATQQLITAAEMERITTLLLEALRVSGFLGRRPIASSEEKIRRLVRRSKLSAGDAESWLGMLRQMLWKMKSAEKPGN